MKKGGVRGREKMEALRGTVKGKEKVQDYIHMISFVLN